MDRQIGLHQTCPARKLTAQNRLPEGFASQLMGAETVARQDLDHSKDVGHFTRVGQGRLHGLGRMNGTGLFPLSARTPPRIVRVRFPSTELVPPSTDRAGRMGAARSYGRREPNNAHR